MSTGNLDPSADVSIDDMLDRINQMAAGGDPAPITPAESQPTAAAAEKKGSSAPITGAGERNDDPNREDNNTFLPAEPQSLKATRISESLIEELICKYLLAAGEASIRQTSDQLGLPFSIIEDIIVRLKQEQCLGYVDQAAMNDYICKLTELGRGRAKEYSAACTYFGAAPVCFEEYVESVNAQTINDQSPSVEDLDRAFSDLLIDPNMMIRLGPAVNSGRGMFLFGFPGNGKTSIAERITAAFGPNVWIPRSMVVDKDIVRIFDPMNHE